MAVFKPSTVKEVTTYCVGGFSGDHSLDFNLAYDLKVNLRSRIGPTIRYYHPIDGDLYVFELVSEVVEDYSSFLHYTCDNHHLHIAVTQAADGYPLYDSTIAKGLRQSIYSWLNLYTLNPCLACKEIKL